MKKIVLGTLVLSVAAFAAVNLGACKGCHGANFEKKALGKSKIVSDMTKQEVINTVRTYNKDKTPKTAANLNEEIRKWRVGGGDSKKDTTTKVKREEMVTGGISFGTTTVDPELKRHETYSDYARELRGEAPKGDLRAK